MLERKPAAAAPPVKTSRRADTRYDVGYPVIGTDESGKGDYFGPLVCAAVCVDEAGAGTLRSIGVRDSKTCTDGEIRELAEKIRELCAGKFEVIEISPERYNTLYGELAREGKNLNTMLAWGHARAIEELLKKVDCSVAIADQFADERYILGKLQAEGQDHPADPDAPGGGEHRRCCCIDPGPGPVPGEDGSDGEAVRDDLSPGCVGSGHPGCDRSSLKKNGVAKLPLVAKMHFQTTAEVQGK